MADNDSGDNIFKVLAFVSPFIASGLTYLLSFLAKKREYLYQYRIPAFTAITAVLYKIEKFSKGKIALELGAETAPYFDVAGSPLELSEQLADVRQGNDIFLTQSSRAALNALSQKISEFSAAELRRAGAASEEEAEEMRPNYQSLLDVVNNCIDKLYSELGLPDK
jgi:hypothetical protein